MSDQTPGPNEGTSMEYLEAQQAEPGERPHGRRWGLIAGATVGVLAVAGAAAWGVGALLGGGPGAATAVPASSLAFLGLDLDPGADQKLEAYQVLRSFPALRESLGDGEDLRRSLVEAVLTDAPCEDLTFDDDFDPWLGSRLAVALVPGEDQPDPVFVVQVSDQEAAKDAVAEIQQCGGETEEPAGTAFTGDYLVLAEDQDIADRAAADAESASLADDDAFNRWVDEAGGAGILTGYVSADAPAALMDAAGDTADSSGLGGDVPDVSSMQDQLDEAFADFEGAAMALRFADGGLEVEAAGSNTGGLTPGEGGDSGLTALPGTTAAALGVGIADDTVAKALDSLADMLGQEELDDALSQLESETGLTPEDLQTLLGDGVSFAVDSSIDVSALRSGSSEIPMGLRINGDPDEIAPLVERLVETAGLTGTVVVERGDGAVAVGMSPEYAALLAGDGDLGGQEAFTGALPELDETAGGLFVDFDAGDWLTRLVQDEEPDAVENLEPLSSLGVSGAVDGDVSRVHLRLAID